MPAHSSAHTAAQRYPHYQRHHAAANGNPRCSTNSNGGSNTNLCCSRHGLSLPNSSSAQCYPAGWVSSASYPGNRDSLPGTSHSYPDTHLALSGSHRRRTEGAHRHALSPARRCSSHAGAHYPPGVPASGCSYTDSGNTRNHQPRLAADATSRANRDIRADTYPGSGAHSPASHRSAHF